VKLNDLPIENWSFRFGFVIPDSTNSWQQIIQSKENMLPPDLISGNITMETVFTDQDVPVLSVSVRLFYEEE